MLRASKRPSAGAAPAPSGAKPVIFAAASATAAPPARQLQSQVIIERWPAGCERGGYRLEGDAVLIFAAGKPDIRIEDAF
jgi:hypothetical protein